MPAGSMLSISCLYTAVPSRSTALLQPTLLQSSQLSTSMPSSVVSTKMLPNLWQKSRMFTTTAVSKEAFVLSKVMQI